MINYTPQRITKVFGLLALAGLSSLMTAQTPVTPKDWKIAGPIYNAGRARNMVVDQANSAVLYVGSASSGIFKSVNNGVKWMPVNDQSDVRNISYLAQGADGTIYAGTGEGFLRSGQKTKALPGTGLYRLDQSNSNLVQVASSSIVGTVINRVACSPVTANNIALATNVGIMVNTGSGFVQANLPAPPTGSTITGQDVKFDSNGILYCSIGAEAGGSTAALASKVYKSTDASLTSFTPITPGSAVLPDNFYGRIELAIAPSNNNVIYASCANKYTGGNTSTLKGLFVSYDAGVNWALIAQGSSQLDPLSNGGTVSSGDYSQVLYVNPTNPDQLFFAGYSFYIWKRYNNSNSNPIGTWLPVGQSFFVSDQSYLHQNIHDIKFVPGTTPRFYFVTDAGVYRSSDLYAYATTGTVFPSFQPFYKGMVTGQYNSVSIERYPIGENIGSTTPSTAIIPYVGFIGGTGGNGLTYFSGKDSLVTEEITHLSGEVYNSEYSKILPNAAYTSLGNGNLYRSANVKVSSPVNAKVNSYTGVLSKIAPTTDDFSNATNTLTGTPFKLWESFGQVNAPDSAYFYNDTVRYQASVSTVSILTTQTVFPFSTARPNKYALIDAVVVRTGTVQLPIDNVALSNAPAFNQPGDGKTIYVNLGNYATPTNTTIVTANPTGASTIPVTFTLNTSSLIDDFNINFPTAPFVNKTATQFPPLPATGTAVIVPDPAVYYRVFATIYYRYKVGDVVTAIDNNISTKTTSYSAVLTQSLSWRDSGNPSSTVASTNTVAVTSPTYVLLSNSIQNPGTQTSSNPIFTVTPSGTTTYTVQKFGTFTVDAKPVNYSVSVSPYTVVITSTNTSASGYTLLPGNVTHSAGGASYTISPTAANPSYTILTPPATGTVLVVETFTSAPTSFSISPSLNTTIANAPNVFVVSPTVTTTYTITQTTGTMTQSSFSTVGTTTYVLNPGAITQIDNPTFTVNTGTTAVTYTIDGLSSNTLAAPNSSITYSFPYNTVTTVSITGVAFAKSNPLVKMPAIIGARIGAILNSITQTGSNDAIIVAKNPLALNDPLAIVRVSQTSVPPTSNPILTDDANGVGSATATIVPLGKATMLEWSKSGTEIYYATIPTGTVTPFIYRLYRVSHINTIMDLSPSSYSGKFNNDIFKYSVPPNSSDLNPASPFRTTLVGSFDKPITSISVSNDSKHVALTFNSTATGTTGTIMYNTNDISKSTDTGAGWVNAQGTLPSTVQITYCSMMEKTNDKILYIGTDNGMYYTSNIASGSVIWDNANKNITSPNNALPKVQVFDIKQQTLAPWDCYNSGQIYVATNGRGIWTNGEYVAQIISGVQEYKKNTSNNLSLYPNPTNGNATLSFNSVDGENATLQIMDISGRVVQSESIGTLSGEIEYSFGTQNLSSGVYIVNIKTDAAVKRVSKLVVTK